MVLADVLAILRSPYASEDAGATPLAVDLTAGVPVTAPTSPDVTALSQIPTVTVAVVGPRPAAAAGAWATLFDVVVGSRDDLGIVEAAVQANPLASLVLVQVLRAGVGLDLKTGLVLESLAYATLQDGPEHRSWLAARVERRREAQPDGAPPVVVERADSGRVARVVLNRPQVRNALDVSMRDALVESLRALACDATVAEIVLSGAGPAFCSGGDLDEFGTAPDPATSHAVRSTRSPAQWLATVAARLTAEVHGVCVGAGVELPAFARRVVARADTSFRLPEVGMGLIPGAGGTTSLPRRIGRQRTAWLALTGQEIDATTALEWGLADEVR